MFGWLAFLLFIAKRKSSFHYKCQGSKFHLSVSPGATSGFSAGQLRLLIWLSVGQPGSRQAPSLVSARNILVSDFNGIPLIQSRQA